MNYSHIYYRYYKLNIIQEFRLRPLRRPPKVRVFLCLSLLYFWARWGWACAWLKGAIHLKLSFHSFTQYIFRWRHCLICDWVILFIGPSLLLVLAYNLWLWLFLFSRLAGCCCGHGCFLSRLSLGYCIRRRGRFWVCVLGSLLSLSRVIHRFPKDFQYCHRISHRASQRPILRSKKIIDQWVA